MTIAPVPAVIIFDELSLAQIVQLNSIQIFLTMMWPHLCSYKNKHFSCKVGTPDVAYKRAIQTFTHNYLQYADSLNVLTVRLG